MQLHLHRPAAQGYDRVVRSRRLTVHQHLTIRAIQEEGEDVVLELHARTGDRHWIRFERLEAPREPRLAVMAGWRDDMTSLTYVQGEGHGRLLDDREHFLAAFGPDGVLED